jgi:hypothetical protein
MYRDGGCLAKGDYNFGGSAGVNLANHLYQIRGEAHMREGGEESRVRDAAKTNTDIQPGNTKRLLASEVASFLWIRLVVAVFHSVGTSFAMKQW